MDKKTFKKLFSEARDTERLAWEGLMSAHKVQAAYTACKVDYAKRFVYPVLEARMLGFPYSTPKDRNMWPAYGYTFK